MDNPNRWHDWYDVLLVSPSASQEEIQQSYNTLIFAVHPDKNKTPQAHEMAKLVNAAKEALLDKDERARFDRQRAERYRANSQARQSRNEQKWRNRVASLQEELEAAQNEKTKHFFSLTLERIRRQQAEKRAEKAELKSENIKKRAIGELKRMRGQIEAAELRAAPLESYGSQDYGCRRYRRHCKVCPNSYSHGYPSRPYECDNYEHCRACFELQGMS